MNEIRIEGLKELEAQFGKIEKGLNKSAKETLLAQARMVRDRIREKAPRGPTGNLKRSPIARMMADKPNYPMLAIAGIDRKIAPHAHLVEFGHAGPHSAPPHPFFRPAIMETLPKAYENIKEDLKEGIERSI